MADVHASKPVLAVEAPLSEMRSAYLWAMRLAGQSDDQLMREQPERARVLEYLKVKDFFANSFESPRGYGVINGDDVPQLFIERVSIPHTVRSVAIGTDGYPQYGDRLADVEASLARALIEDPLMIESYRGPKGLVHGRRSYDDRAFIALDRVR